LELEIEQFISYYNNQRYHEALNNITPADVYYGRHRETITRRELLKQQTLKAGNHYNLSQLTAHNISWNITPLVYLTLTIYIFIVPRVLIVTTCNNTPNIGIKVNLYADNESPPEYYCTCSDTLYQRRYIEI
jgi:hypothetical protein